MIESDFDRLAKRVDAIYGERKSQPDIPAVYVVEPPQMPKQTELDQARALVVAALREIPGILLTLAALLVLLARNAWRWCRQWKRTPQIG
jgi:hypothetical protein